MFIGRNLKGPLFHMERYAFSTRDYQNFDACCIRKREMHCHAAFSPRLTVMRGTASLRGLPIQAWAARRCIVRLIGRLVCDGLALVTHPRHRIRRYVQLSHDRNSRLFSIFQSTSLPGRSLPQQALSEKIYHQAFGACAGQPRLKFEWCEWCDIPQICLTDRVHL